MQELPAEVIVNGYFRSLNSRYNKQYVKCTLAPFVELILIFHGIKALYMYDFRKENLINKVAMRLTIPDLKKKTNIKDALNDVSSIDPRREGMYCVFEHKVQKYI